MNLDSFVLGMTKEQEQSFRNLINISAGEGFFPTDAQLYVIAQLCKEEMRKEDAMEMLCEQVRRQNAGK